MDKFCQWLYKIEPVLQVIAFIIVIGLIMMVW